MPERPTNKRLKTRLKTRHKQDTNRTKKSGAKNSVIWSNNDKKMKIYGRYYLPIFSVLRPKNKIYLHQYCEYKQK